MRLRCLRTPMCAFTYDTPTDPINVLGSQLEVLADTLGIKMTLFTCKPGESWKIHDHPDHTFYVLEGGKYTMYTNETGKVDIFVVPSRVGGIIGPISDSGTNIGNTTIKLLVRVIYHPRGEINISILLSVKMDSSKFGVRPTVPFILI